MKTRLAVLIGMITAAGVQAQSPTPSAMRRQMDNAKPALSTGSNAVTGSGPSVAIGNPKGTGLPWPIEGRSFSLTEINLYRKHLIGKIVWVKLEYVEADQEPEGDQYKVFVMDPKSSGIRPSNYQFVYFPDEGVKKMNLLGKTTRGSMSFYVMVEPARLTAVARSRHIDSFSNTFKYTW